MVQAIWEEDNKDIEETLAEETLELQNSETFDETFGSVDENLFRCSGREFNKVCKNSIILSKSKAA